MNVSPLHSAIYEGAIRHRRFHEVEHQFSYPVSYFYIDLEEVEQIFTLPVLFHSRFPSLFRFDRSIMMRPVNATLKSVALDACFNLTGIRPSGRVRVLTQLSAFGIGFNPVSFYYFFDENDDQDCKIVLAEITNTPWSERHSYAQVEKRSTFEKVFHVSPFLSLNYKYKWDFSNPGNTLSVHMENLPNSSNASIARSKHFDATLSLRRIPITKFNILSTLLRYPVPALKSLTAIYLHALYLWIRGATFFPHPQANDDSHTPNLSEGH